MFIALSVLLAAACLVPAIAKLGAHPKMLASGSIRYPVAALAH